RAVRQGGQTREGHSQSQSPDAGANGRNDPFARDFLHEPLSQARIHSIQRRNAGPQLATEHPPSRLTLPLRALRPPCSFLHSSAQNSWICSILDRKRSSCCSYFSCGEEALCTAQPSTKF